MAAPSLSVNLPWQQLANQANAFQFGGSPEQAMAQLGPAYAGNYQAALGLNAAISQGGQTGYDTLRSSVDNSYKDIAAGYNSLYGDVLGKIAGTNASNIQDINTAYTAQSGKAAQEMVSRGLGNTTVQQNMQRAIALDRARAQTQSEGQFAQLGAGYMNQIGQAGLQAKQQGIGLGANLGQAQLAQLERTTAAYPDPGQYMQLAQMYGQQKQAQDAGRGQNAAEKLGMYGAGGSNYTVGPSSGFAPRPSGYDYYGSGNAHSGYTSGSTSNYVGGYSPQPYQPTPALGFQSGNYNSPLGEAEAWYQGSGEGGMGYGLGAIGGAMAGMGYGASPGYGSPEGYDYSYSEPPLGSDYSDY